ncbi:sodium:alanine symporter family protein [bacterium]|nr:sodium:alanine symporter family protein [bacterium]
MSEILLKINTTMNDLVWGPYMLIALVGVGIYLTLRARFIQLAKFGLMWRETLGKAFRKSEGAEGDVSPMQAMTVAMAGTVGVGNIAGVATAIAIGGPGAIFWMLVSALFGMATKFAEVVLGCHYRVRREGQPMLGGPMMYIERGLGSRWKWLAVIFCVFGAIAAFGIGNMVQANSVADGMSHFGAPDWVTGLMLIVSVGLVTIGGIKRIAQVAVFCVPFMCILYILGAFTVIVVHVAQLPKVIVLILKSAFTMTAATGGFAGVGIMMAIRHGIAKGVFSNEAGLGSAPMAHATATTDHPVRQGLWGIFEVFFDTIVMCTATALVILLTGVWSSGESGAVLTISGFSSVFGETTGAGLLMFCMILTAYDTLLAWCFYGETCMAYLLGHGNVVRMVYRIAWLPFTMLGAVGSLRIVWDVADTLNGLMAIPNLIALAALGGVVIQLVRGYFAGKPYVPQTEAAGIKSEL